MKDPERQRRLLRLNVLTWWWWGVQTLLDERHGHHDARESSWTVQLFGPEGSRGGTEVEEPRREVVLSRIWQEMNV